MAEVLRVIKGAYVSWKFVMIENHPADSRVRIAEDNICQALTGRMGTGGGNVPLVLCFTKSRRAQSKDDYETWIQSDASNTINTFDMGDVRSTTLVIHGKDSTD